MGRGGRGHRESWGACPPPDPVTICNHLRQKLEGARGAQRGQGSGDPGPQGHARTPSGSTRPRQPLDESPSCSPEGQGRRDQRGQDAGDGPPGLEGSPALRRRGRPRRKGPSKSRTPGSLLLQRGPLLLLRPCSAPQLPRPLRTTPGGLRGRSPPRGPSPSGPGHVVPGRAGLGSGRSLRGSACSLTGGRSGGRSGGGEAREGRGRR